jgi:hypothetical protein
MPVGSNRELLQIAQVKEQFSYPYNDLADKKSESKEAIIMGSA